jgi:Tol biopolymer transport system component
MTGQSDLERLLHDHYSSKADARVPAGQLAAIEARIASTRRDPEWLAGVRGTGMAGTTVQRASAFPIRRLAWAAVLAALLLALLGALLLAGQRSPNLFHAGLLSFARDGDIYFAKADGSGEARVAHVDGLSLDSPVWSPEGGHVAIQTPEPAVLLLDARTLQLRRVAAGQFKAWSPDGRYIAVSSGNDSALRIVDVSSGVSRDLVQAASRGFGDQTIAWSPDGRWLAAWVAEYGGLVRIDVATGASRVLDAATSWDEDPHPTWSPDSRQIAFAHCTDPACRTTGTARTVVVADAEGGNRREIATNAVDPAWSPDGAWIAFRSDLVGGRLGPRGTRGMTGGLALVRPDGSDRRTLVPASEVVGRLIGWSGDARALLYADGAGSGRGAFASQVDVTGGEVRFIGGQERGSLYPTAWAWQILRADVPVAAVPGPIRAGATAVESSAPAPAQAPPADPRGAGSSLAFTSERSIDDDCAVSLHVLDLTTRTTRDVAQTHQTNVNCAASLAPNGSAFVAWTTAGLDVVRRDGSVVLHLASRAVDAGSFGVTWSPDARRALVEDCSGQGSCQHMIYALAGDGPSSRASTSIPDSATWSRDGSHLALTTSADGLIVGAGDGSGLAKIGGRGTFAAWAPDGTRLAFLRDGDVWVIGADGQGERNLTHFEFGGAVGASWSPDGATIAVISGPNSLWFFPADGSAPGRLVSASDLSLGSWAPDGRTIYVVARAGERLIAVADGHAVAFGNCVGSPTWSPDGRFVACVSTSPDTGVTGIDVANADGSGRHTIWSDADIALNIDQLVWVP